MSPSPSPAPPPPLRMAPPIPQEISSPAQEQYSTDEPLSTGEYEVRPRADSDSSTETVTVDLLNSGIDRPLYRRRSNTESLLEEEDLSRAIKAPTNTPESQVEVVLSSPSLSSFPHFDLPSPNVTSHSGHASLLNTPSERHPIQRTWKTWAPLRAVSSSSSSSSFSYSRSISPLVQEIPFDLDVPRLPRPRPTAHSFVAQRTALFEARSGGQAPFLPPSPLVITHCVNNGMSPPRNWDVSSANPHEMEKEEEAFAVELTKRLRLVEHAQETDLPPPIPPRNPARLLVSHPAKAGPSITFSPTSTESLKVVKEDVAIAEANVADKQEINSDREENFDEEGEVNRVGRQSQKGKENQYQDTPQSQGQFDDQYPPRLSLPSNIPTVSSLIRAYPHLDPGHPGIDSKGRPEYTIINMQKITGLHRRIGERLHKLPLPILDRIVSLCVLRPYVYPFRYPTCSLSYHQQEVFTGVLHLSRRLTKRALYLLYTRNDFHFRHAADLVAFAATIGPENAKRVRSLSIAISLRPAPWIRPAFTSALLSLNTDPTTLSLNPNDEDTSPADELWEALTATETYPPRHAKVMEDMHEFAVIRVLGAFYAPLAALLEHDPRPFPLPHASLPPQEQVLSMLGIPHKPPQARWNVFPALRVVEFDIQDLRCERGCHGVWTCDLLLPVLRALRARCALIQLGGGDGWEEAKAWFEENVLKDDPSLEEEG